MSLRDLRPLLAVAVLGTLVAVLVMFGVVGTELLVFAPALLLVTPLLMGRYVGERSLRRLAVRFARPHRRVASVLPPAMPGRTRRAVVCGGLLLAERLAGRAPPHALLTVR